MQAGLTSAAAQRYIARHRYIEQSAPYLLCCSDCQALSQTKALQLADEECRRMCAREA